MWLSHSSTARMLVITKLETRRLPMISSQRSGDCWPVRRCRPSSARMSGFHYIDLLERRPSRAITDLESLCGDRSLLHRGRRAPHHPGDVPQPRALLPHPAALLHLLHLLRCQGGRPSRFPPARNWSSPSLIRSLVESTK